MRKSSILYKENLVDKLGPIVRRIAAASCNNTPHMYDDIYAAGVLWLLKREKWGKPTSAKHLKEHMRRVVIPTQGFRESYEIEVDSVNAKGEKVIKKKGQHVGRYTTGYADCMDYLAADDGNEHRRSMSMGEQEDNCE